MTWWVITNQTKTIASSSFTLAVTTNHADHCWMCWSYVEPARRLIYKVRRGTRYACGYKYIWRGAHTIEQAEPGDTLTHTFSAAGLEPGSTIYYYIWAPDGPYGNEIQGPLSSFTLSTGPPPPIPAPAPITLWVGAHNINSKNHYTFWANGSWYALIHQGAALSMWKDTGGAYTHLDSANDPLPTRSYWSDATAVLGPNLTTLYIVAYDQGSFFGPHTVWLLSFDTLTDTWAAPITSLTAAAYGLGNSASLVIDQATGLFHVFFNATSGGLLDVWYAAWDGASWSSPVAVIAGGIAIWTAVDAAYLSTTNQIAVVANRNTNVLGVNQANATTPVWPAYTGYGGYMNTGTHGTVGGQETLHCAAHNLSGDLDHRYGTLLASNEPSLYTAGYYAATALCQPNINPHLAINLSLSSLGVYQIHKPPGGSWSSVTLKLSSLGTLFSSTLAAPDVISCITRHSTNEVTLWQWYAPWHT